MNATITRQDVLDQAAAEGFDPKVVAASGYVNAERLAKVLQSMRDSRDYQPQVGDGMTLYYPQDRYGYVITRVSESGKTVWVKPLTEPSRATGHEPARHDGPWPVWTHHYTDEERQTMVQDLANEQRVTRSRDGLSWSMNGLSMARGGAMYHRNYSY